MQTENKTIVKPLTPGELALLYGVSIKTLKTWIDNHKAFIGSRVAKYFTSLQVRKIYQCLGTPSSDFEE